MKKAILRSAAPYADDAMNLPVPDVEAAIPYYEERLGFRVVSRNGTPHRSVVLARDDIKIGLAENGGDPSQEGCFFRVDDVESAFEEFKGRAPEGSDLEVQTFGKISYRVFFEVAPDGLCYMFGERVE
jgi:catechol 2,3-dioxygenase-like lactoylglutathione lyase family enzyme